MISIYFVRHALPDYSFDDDATMPLTAEGKRDSLKVLNKLNNAHFDFCLSSPYKRTIETILPLVKQLNLDLHTDPRLKERIRGEVNDNYQELLKKRWDNFDFHEENGESMNSLQQRNIAVLFEILSKHKNENILFSTHGAALSSILNYFNPNFGYLDFVRIQNFTPYILKIDFNEQNKIIGQKELLIISK